MPQFPHLERGNDSNHTHLVREVSCQGSELIQDRALGVEFGT